VQISDNFNVTLAENIKGPQIVSKQLLLRAPDQLKLRPAVLSVPALALLVAIAPTRNRRGRCWRRCWPWSDWRLDCVFGRSKEGVAKIIPAGIPTSKYDLHSQYCRFTRLNDGVSWSLVPWKSLR